MTAAITLAGPDNLDSVVMLMARCHEERTLDHDDAHRTQVVSPLLSGSPLGAIWIVGPVRAPLGYLLMSFGWSVTYGGMIGRVEDIYVRKSVRRRGIGTEVLHAVAVSLREADVTALLAEVPESDANNRVFCQRAGFSAKDGPVMVDIL
jgi:GNAT superfamily N-acetyltransferase